MKVKRCALSASMKARKSHRRSYYAKAVAATVATTTTSKALVLASPTSSSTMTSVEDCRHHQDKDALAVRVKTRSDMAEAVVAVESLLGYAFREPRLLEEALTHSSYPSHPSYQRLEFVGDAALGLALANHIFLTNPGVGPGRLSLIRAANISTEKLARVAVRHGLYAHLRRNVPHLDALVNEFTASVVREEAGEAEFAAVYGGSSVKAPKVLADIVESVAAALYVDCGFDLDTLWRVFRVVLEPIISSETLHDQPVSALNNFCQKQGRSLELKNRRKGNRIFVNVFVDGKLLGRGCSDQRDIAKLNAAREALQKLMADNSTTPGKDPKVGATEVHDDDDVVLHDNGEEASKENEEAKKTLNELCGKSHWPHPVYRIVSEQGPAHNKTFVCSVRVKTSNGGVHVVASDRKWKKKDAENVAASKMLKLLTEMHAKN